MEIVSLQRENRKHINQAAQLLVEGFRENWPEAWPDLPSALREVEECLGAERICRVALNDQGDVVGWAGAISGYKGHVWELHPLVVDTRYRRRGIGTKLVRDIEEQVRQRGGLTIFAGSDDENGMTSLAHVDLHDNLLNRIRNIRNLKGHPYEFYLKMGFQIVGVLPDANGLGKPDILLAKRVIPWPETGKGTARY